MKKRSIGEIIITKIRESRKEEPITDEQIKQLKKELEYTKLKRQLAEEKAKMPNKFDNLKRALALLGDNNK